MASEDFKRMQFEIIKLKKRQEEMRRTISLIKGLPIIQASAGKRFDLNDNLNVIELKWKIRNCENVLNNNHPVPASRTASGEKNQVAYDEDYLYIARDDNTWERIPWDDTWGLTTEAFMVYEDEELMYSESLDNYVTE